MQQASNPPPYPLHTARSNVQLHLPRQVATTYTVSGASGAYKFALPAKDQDHLAFLSVTVDKKELEFQLEASPPEGLVMYSAAVGQVDDGTKIAVGGKG